MSDSSICIITARGGSKRIPGKNIKEFLKEPIINYSVKAALNSGIFDEVMVSTDDDKIAGTAIKAGASVPFMRSAETSGDTATTAEVILEVLEKYSSLGKTFDYVCCMYPTAPFITPEKLKKSLEILKEKNANSVIPVVRFSYPPQRGYIIENGVLKYKWPENYSKRSQDLEPLYHDSGQFYFYKADFFIKTKGLNFEDMYPLILSDLEVQDIDTPDDWETAEMKYSILREKGILK